VLPCIIFEDEHLLVVNKPAGVNTHAPAPFAGEGIYDWLRSREPRWASLAIVHRLDKETSGVMVFTKTRLANQSLTRQFTERHVKKTYLFLSDKPMIGRELVVKTSLVRMGERYASRPGNDAVTRFRKVAPPEGPFLSSCAESEKPSAVQAEPLTGRTHQIRVHAAESGFPVLGDTLYGGTAGSRVFLHACSIRFRHPATRAELTFAAPVNFRADPRLQLREAFVDPGETDCFRVVHGAADGQDGWYVDKLGPYLLSQAEQPLDESKRKMVVGLVATVGAQGASHKRLRREVRRASASEASPEAVLDEPAPAKFTVRENGLRFELRFNEGYSVGLFLDQRDNRRRLLTGWAGPDFGIWAKDGAGEVLNTFAYTCGFSVCAAKAGAHVTSLDLSTKYLDWGRRNFTLNGLPDETHDFIYGDTFPWLKRLARKGRRFDLVLLDPPTFSHSKATGVFRAEKDYAKLVAAALPVVKPGGVLFASSNAAGWAPESFLAAIQAGARLAGRTFTRQQYAPQPPDFPVSRAEPAYLKTVWLRVT
jgi:23S rRNA (cytosine1962-C5)-methyltransferase